MHVWICTDFVGYYPVGTAAVVVAETEAKARSALLRQLESMGLAQIDPVVIKRLPISKPKVAILSDGNY